MHRVFAIDQKSKHLQAGIPENRVQKVLEKIDAASIKTVFTSMGPLLVVLSCSVLGQTLWVESTFFKEGEGTRKIEAALMRDATVGIRADVHVKKLWLIP